MFRARTSPWPWTARQASSATKGFIQLTKGGWTQDLLDYYSVLVQHYPLVSIEDPVDEEDFNLMALMTLRIGRELQIIGDDMFVTDVERIKKPISKKAGNCTLLKVNQIGTVSESMDARRSSRSMPVIEPSSVIVLERDRGYFDSRPGSGAGLRADKDGRSARAERTAKVQSPAANRGDARQ